MRERDRRAELEQRAARTGKDLVPDHGMALHLDALLGRQRTGPQDHVVGQCHLADVVHRARDPDGLVVEAQLAREQRGVCAHPLGVAAGLLVAVLDRAREPPHRFLARELETRGGALERGCARPHDLLEGLALGAVLDAQPTALERPAQPDQHLRGAERLEDVPVGTDVDRAFGDRGIVDPGDHHGRGVGGPAEHILHKLESRLVREVDVAQDRVVLLRGAHPARGRRVDGDVPAVAAALQGPREQRLRLAVVLDDQDLFRVAPQ